MNQELPIAKQEVERRFLGFTAGEWEPIVNAALLVTTVTALVVGTAWAVWSYVRTEERSERNTAREKCARAHELQNEAWDLLAYEEGAVSIRAFAPTQQRELARRKVQQAMMLCPALPEAHSKLGLYLVSEGKWRAAEVELRKALDGAPTDAIAHGNYGAVLAELRREDEAKLHLQEAARLDASNPLFQENLALFFGRQGELAQARFHASLARELRRRIEKARPPEQKPH